MSGGIELRQRYELAAALCRGFRVLELGEGSTAARSLLEQSAGELRLAGDEGAGRSSLDAAVALDGLREPDRRESVLAEAERLARDGVRVLLALEQDPASSGRPRETAGRAARALAERFAGGVLLHQFLADGALISGGESAAEQTPALHILDGEVSEEDAAAVIIAVGFEPEELSRGVAHVRVTAAPVLRSYVRSLEIAHAELLRANRELMRERIGRGGSAAVSLLNAQRELGEMKAIARQHEEQVRRIEAWYDAPRYHLVDRVRTFMTKVPGLTGGVRLLWSLISTRAETPELEAAARPQREEVEEAAEVTRAREGLDSAEEEKRPSESYSRLEE